MIKQSSHPVNNPITIAKYFCNKQSGNGKDRFIFGKVAGNDGIARRLF
jgi:hypothetical protein